MKTCHVTEIEHQHPVTLYERSTKGQRRFRVQYGSQVRDRLTWEEAAAEFGECVFHALACNGDIRND